MPEDFVEYPSDTILFGEKDTTSTHYYMDFLEPPVGNDLSEIEESRHMGRGGRGGGSNFAFVDGSARTLRYGEMRKPYNLWAVTDAWRKAAVP